ncbi:MAG: hypothetical protein EOP84_30965, partial [Verrucomicrobiaceae bacterium]
MFPQRIFALSSLAVCLLAQPFTSVAADFSFKDKPGESLDVLQDGKLVARYMYGHDVSTPQRRDETYKPYLHVFDAAGKETITKGAGGQLPHHRGIFIGWNKLSVAGEVFDRWHMKGGDQVHQKFLDQKTTPNSATFTSQVEWMGKDASKVVLKEDRTFTFLTPPPSTYALIDTSSKLTAVGGETELGGDPEHAGLQFRPSGDIVPTETSFFFPGNPDLKKDRDLPWYGGTFTIRGQRYSVVYLNHPSNPKDAVTSAYRDYGRFGTFFKDVIPAGGEKTIRARFLVSEGEMPSAEIIQKA